MLTTTAGIDYYRESSIDQFIIGMQKLNTHNVYKSNIWRNRTLW
jgi:hypothetical protein